MSISIHHAEEADMHRLFEIASLAFKDNEPFWDACYPEHWTPAGRKAGGDRFLAIKQGDPKTTYLKAIDDSTGEIAGFAKCNVFEDRFPERGLAEGDYWESEEAREYAQHLIDEFNKDRVAYVKKANGNVVNLDILAIDPKFQRRGIGGKLVAWGTEQADERDFEAIVESSVFGKGLYEKNGFVWQKDVTLPLEGKWEGRRESRYAWLVRPRRSER